MAETLAMRAREASIARQSAHTINGFERPEVFLAGAQHEE